MGLIADIHNDLEKGAVRLISEYRARLISDAIKLCKDASGAEDLVSRTLVKVINKIDSYDDNYDFYVWMKTIMVNIHRNDQDRPVARGTMPVEDGALEQYAGADWSTDEELLRNSDCEVLREVLQRIDPKERDILLMRYYDGFSLKEIANVLNMPVSTVGRRIHLAMRLLAGKLGTKMGKKPLAVLGILLLGAATLFGAWQGGLLGDVEEQKDEPSASVQLQENDVQPKQHPNGGINEMKLTSTLKSVAAAALTTVALASDGVTIDVTKAQQRYPWNGLVDIDYTITRDQGESALDPLKHRVRISVVNCAETPAVTNVAHVFRQGTLPVSDGTHRVTWDANAEGVNFKSQDVKVFAEIIHYAEKYMVIDVSGGPNTNCYPVTYLQGAPGGDLNTDEYKGDKIVLRLIPPGSFVMGSPSTEPGRKGSKYDTTACEVQHAVAITKPFYIGVFQITQKQYLNVMDGKNPSRNTGDYRPVEQVSYNTIRGTVEGVKWPQTNSVDATSFMGKLRSKCKEWDSDKQSYAKDVDGLFDLPTEAQWEYACRAGKTTPFNNGEPCANDADLDTQLSKLGCYKSNGNGHAVVGSYDPNAWGLYDMHGNVWEWCLDWYQEDVQNIENPSVDPVGPAVVDVAKRVTRGGSWDNAARECRSAFRNPFSTTTTASDRFGFRLSRTLP